jgi:hypothetical protein
MPNKVYFARETVLTAQASGSPDITFTLDNIASGAGRVSAQYDRTNISLPPWVLIRGIFRANATTGLAIGEAYKVRFVHSNDSGGERPGGLGTADAAVSVEADLRNTIRIGNVQVDNVSTTRVFVAEWIVELRHRYLQFAFWNATSEATNSTANVNKLTIGPVPDELQ